MEYSYDAWGKVLSVSNKTTANIGTLNPFRYRSYYYDTETGLYYLQTRYYDPEVGRFINADDPFIVFTLGLGIINGINFESYCFNNPIMYVDDGGFFPIKINLPIEKGMYIFKKNFTFRFDEEGTASEHIHICYNGRNYSWYREKNGATHNKRHAKDGGLNDFSNSAINKLIKLGVPKDYFEEYVAMPQSKPIPLIYPIINQKKNVEIYPIDIIVSKPETVPIINDPNKGVTVDPMPEIDNSFVEVFPIQNDPGTDILLLLGIVALWALAIALAPETGGASLLLLA